MPSKSVRIKCPRVCSIPKLKMVPRVVVVPTGQRSPKNHEVRQISDNGDAFVCYLKDKPFYSSLILKYEKTIQINSETKEQMLLVEPILEILKQILENGQSDGIIRNDIGTKELVAILWSQMLGVLNTLSGRQEMLKIYGVDQEWIIRGHYRLIMSGLSKSNA